MAIRTAVIPCAGLGTRFLPVTRSVPKELFPIGTKPTIQYVVEEAVAAGVETVILVCHQSKTLIADYFRPAPELDHITSRAAIRVVYQETPRGLGDAVRCARAAVGTAPFAVLLPDVLIRAAVPALRQLVEGCAHAEGSGLLLERVSRDAVDRYGMIRGTALTNGTCRILGAVEKPAPATAPSDLAIVGRYLLPPAIFEYIDRSAAGTRGEIQLTDALHTFAQDHPLCGVLCQGTIFDVGYPEGLQRVYREWMPA